MNSLKLIFGSTLIGIGVIMVATNPDHASYQEFAADTLNVYLKEQICTQVSYQLGNFLQSHCLSLVDTTRPHLAKIVAQNTQRYNFILFSIYQTDLSVSSALPEYNVSTIGVLENFYIYQAEQI
ncbi:MAG: hypothetical protein Kow0049_05150 [Stanieria sp.]